MQAIHYFTLPKKTMCALTKCYLSSYSRGLSYLLSPYSYLKVVKIFPYGSKCKLALCENRRQVVDAQHIARIEPYSCKSKNYYNVH